MSSDKLPIKIDLLPSASRHRVVLVMDSPEPIGMDDLLRFLQGYVSQMQSELAAIRARKKIIGPNG